jgi:hypothetical protein
MVGSTLVKIDEFVYGDQKANTSYSRIPNLTGPFLETSKLTPMADNVFEVPTPVEESVTGSINIFPNPSESAVRVVVSEPVDFMKVFSMEGKLVEVVENFTGERTVLSGNVPEGLYVFMFSVRGQIVVRKVIRR